MNRRILTLVLLVVTATPALGQPGARSCRGEGVTEVKAADEHCGFVPRARKESALGAACELAEEIEPKLRETAEGEARTACPEREGEECSVKFRRWENVYTHALSGKCWTSCGWAAVVSCEKADNDNGARRP